MNRTQLLLIEQMGITEFEIDNRKALFSLTFEDIQSLLNAKVVIEHHITKLVSRFYQNQTDIPEIALLIGDAETLERLKQAQRGYILDLFSGFYGVSYVNNRLRIGMVHKRIGVEPKLYLSAIQTLKQILFEVLEQHIENQTELIKVKSALEKLLMFDVSLVVDIYIKSLISEIEIAKEKVEQYAYSLENKVKERTIQLESLSRTDPLTGLNNVRYLHEILSQALAVAKRRSEHLVVAYIDIDNFKEINDTEGHQRGDEVICYVASSIKKVSRMVDHCFRYGGDEFFIIMPKCTQKQAEELYSSRLLDEIHQQEPTLSISIGFAQADKENYPSADKLIHLADKRMYLQKKSSKADDEKSIA